MLRDNGGQDICFDDDDRRHFYLLMQQGVAQYGHRIHGLTAYAGEESAQQSTRRRVL